MTYGRLINEAKRQLGRCLTARATMSNPTDALAVCDARASLYRALAGALTLHLNLPDTAGRRRFAEFNDDGIGRREATLLEVLRADLQRSTRTGGDTWQPPANVSDLAKRLRTAADCAGAAFDLLAGHLSPADPRLQLNSSPLRQGGTRVTALDAVRLTRSMAQLDRKLELPIRNAARVGLDNHDLRWLVATADDCKRVTQTALREFAAAIEHVLKAPDRTIVDGLDLAAPAFDHQSPPRDPSDAADFLARLRAAAEPELLSIRDLSAIASASARACVVVGYACTEAGAPVGIAIKAARTWRRLHDDLVPFASRGGERGLTGYAHQFCRWADPFIRHGPQTPLPITGSPAAFWQIPTELPRLAKALADAVEHLLERTDLLLPFDPTTRGREHLYVVATPSNERVQCLRRTTANILRSTQDLARSVALPASAGRVGATAVAAASRAAPNPRRAAPRTPPPPASQSQQGRRRANR